MTQREREHLAEPTGELDPHSVLFGLGEDEQGEGGAPAAYVPRAEGRRSEHARRRRRRRRARFFMLLIVLLVAAVAFLVVPRVRDYFAVKDYSGTGTGAVTVTVPEGASAGDIGDLLLTKGVVRSRRAFTDAASSNSKSQSIQPGVYHLHRHMSGKSALSLLLDPAARDAASDLLIPEGATSLDVADRVTKLCGARQGTQARKAMSDGPDLGVPVTYKVGTTAPNSVEGFLFPATYTVDQGCSATDALQRMVTRFIQQDRSTHFAADAAKVGLTPYQALIVASIAQSEAKYPEDMPKVVRTVLNRIQAQKPLQFDSTSSYACKLAGTPADKCIYSQIDSPYNTYQNAGLPPTPINNPGAEAMNAAVHPAAGNFLFFVNQDKDGHLFFTDDPVAFEKARQKCAKYGWGCA